MTVRSVDSIDSVDSVRADRTARRPRGLRVLAAASGAVAVVLLAGACGASADDDSDPERRAFALEGKTLTVDSDDSALEFVTGESGSSEVKVTRWFEGASALGGDTKVTWAVDGDRLTLRMKCSGVFVDCSAKHRIEVPRGVALKVVNGDGRVSASGMLEPLSIRTKDGSVTVKDSTGPLRLDSGDGAVNATGVRSERVRATSKDGAVRLELASVPDRVEARSADGAVTIEVPKKRGGRDVSYDVATRTADGAVDVSVPRDSGSPHLVSARSEDGKVTVRSAN
ncbi:DUF4097 family beta strand repeat-containing protein [Streptomyces rectiviolaceus]|uniref:DUF4097 family beta strand repeat-containing protein n=1 Tax=Streptomyces rectiviolaceus TaxID=332591 RepID=A0ABP6MIK3_9ACTN